jgi:hypothetical protein
MENALGASQYHLVSPGGGMQMRLHARIPQRIITNYEPVMFQKGIPHYEE